MDIPTHNTEERDPAQNRANKPSQVHLTQALTGVMKQAWTPKKNNQELFRTTHRKQFNKHITYIATYVMECFSFPPEFLTRIWCQWIEFCISLHFPVFQSVRPQRHQMSMWGTTHTHKTLMSTNHTARNINIKYVCHVWFINSELWESILNVFWFTHAYVL